MISYMPCVLYRKVGSAARLVLPCGVPYIWSLPAAFLVGHMVPGGCIVRCCTGPASAVVLFADDGDGPILRLDSSHDGSDTLRKQPKTGRVSSVSSDKCDTKPCCGTTDLLLHHMTACCACVWSASCKCLDKLPVLLPTRADICCCQPTCAPQSAFTSVAYTEALSQQNQALQSAQSSLPALPPQLAGTLNGIISGLNSGVSQAAAVSLHTPHCRKQCCREVSTCKYGSMYV